MPVPVIVVEVAPPDVGQQAAAVLVETCTKAVRKGRCVLASSQAEDSAPAALAIVSWDGDKRLHAHIQVGVQRDLRSRWATRDIHFEPNDPELERWRSAGLTIAILIGELPETRALASESEPDERSAGSEEPSAPPQVASGPRASAVPRASPPPRERHSAGPPVESPASEPGVARGFVDAQFLVGTGLDQGPLRRGVAVTAGYSLAHAPLWFPVSLSYAVRPTDDASVSVTWLTLAAGVGTVWQVPGIEMELDARVFVGAEQVAASAEHPVTGREDSAHRWVPVVGIAGGPAFPLGSLVSFAAQGQLWRSFRTLVVSNAGQEVAHTRAWSGAVQVGPRLTFQ